MLVWGPMKVWLRGSGVLSSVCDVLEMSVVRGVGGVCDMCMCSGRGDRIGFGPYHFWGNMGKVGYVSLFWLRWCWGRVGGRLWVWEGRCCYVCVCYGSGLSVFMAGPCICILC